MNFRAIRLASYFGVGRQILQKPRFHTAAEPNRDFIGAFDFVGKETTNTSRPTRGLTSDAWSSRSYWDNCSPQPAAKTLKFKLSVQTEKLCVPQMQRGIGFPPGQGNQEHITPRRCSGTSLSASSVTKNRKPVNSGKKINHTPERRARHPEPGCEADGKPNQKPFYGAGIQIKF